MVSSSCFGVTYEGLKLGSVLKTRDGRYGFGVTYEGLKRIVEDTQPGLWVGFGVTYEGLKRQFYIAVNTHQLTVLELPMRV